MIFRRLTPDRLMLILALLALLAMYLVLRTEFWQMDMRCGAWCGLHMLKGWTP